MNQTKWWAGLLVGLMILATACAPPAPTMAPVENDSETDGETQGVRGAPAVQDEEPTPEEEATPPPAEGAEPDEATVPDAAESETTPEVSEPGREMTSNPKLESRLAQLGTIHASDGLGPASDMAAAMGLQLQADRVLVIITVTSADQVEEVIAAVEAVGGTVDGTTGVLVQAWLPIGRLNDLASDPAVLAIQGAQAAAPAGDVPAGGPEPPPNPW